MDAIYLGVGIVFFVMTIAVVERSSAKVER